MRRSVCYLVVALACAGACRTAYPAPPPGVLTSTETVAITAEDRGDVTSLNQMERQCRARLERDTADASLTALDRVHEVLGSSCDVATVDRDPLHWVLHCRSDALFKSGQYTLEDTSSVACRELSGARVNQWQCVGAVFQDLFARGAAIDGISTAVVGHVDMQPLNPGSDSHVCTALMQSLQYTPSTPWEPVPTGATDEQRQHANEQLAFCRAASVGDQLRQGMTRKDASTSGSELAVVGAGSSWLRSQRNGVCPAHGKAWQERADCLDARRVDLLVRFTPKAERSVSPCDADRSDPSGALYCLEQCLEQAAMGSRAGTGFTTASVPLFAATSRATTALPSGFYLHHLGTTTTRRLDLTRVCTTLGMDSVCSEPR